MRHLKPSIHKRKDKIWPYGYYIPAQRGMQPGEWGYFVCSTLEEAQKGITKDRRKKDNDCN